MIIEAIINNHSFRLYITGQVQSIIFVTDRLKGFWLNLIIAQSLPFWNGGGVNISRYLLFVVALVTHKYQKLAGAILLDYFTFVMNQEKHAGPWLSLYWLHYLKWRKFISTRLNIRTHTHLATTRIKFNFNTSKQLQIKKQVPFTTDQAFDYLTH